MNQEQITAKRHRLPHVDVYDVSGDELDNLERVGSHVGTDLQWTTFWFPIGLSALLTLIATPVPNAHVYEAYLVACFVGFGFSIYFATRWWSNRGEFKNCIGKIRQREVGPLGEEGKEVKPSRLETLPAVAPPQEPQK